VHGSIAFGCFNTARSDLDVLAVVAEPLSEARKLELADAVLHISAAPYAVELHVVLESALRNWNHPLPFELHYSETYREGFGTDPLGTLARMPRTDPDLAAHVAVTREAGIALVGRPVVDVVPAVPWNDVRDALLRDLEWTRTARSALYGVLSPCRVWATLETGELHSKLAAAQWALERLPAELRAPVERALASYAGDGEPIELAEDERARLWDYVDERVRSIAVS
jgi:aminoglycoside adenylyltransferase-like protein